MAAILLSCWLVYTLNHTTNYTYAVYKFLSAFLFKSCLFNQDAQMMYFSLVKITFYVIYFECYAIWAKIRREFSKFVMTHCNLSYNCLLEYRLF